MDFRELYFGKVCFIPQIRQSSIILKLRRHHFTHTSISDLSVKVGLSSYRDQKKTFFASLKGILSFEELLWTSTYSEQLLLISKRCHPQISFFEGISWSFFVLSDILVVLYRLRWRTIDVIDHVLSFDYPSIYNYLPTHLYIFSKCSSRAAIDCFNS